MSIAQTVTIASGILLMANHVWAQGNLTPPGAPGPSMKTLGQVEPRTPVDGATTISQPGSYYLSGPVTNGGLTVSANDVTLDLNGFPLTGDGTGNGITVNNSANGVVVRNGSIRGFNAGLVAVATVGCLFEKLTVADSTQYGIYFNGVAGVCNGNSVTACTLTGNGGSGIHFAGNSGGECSFNLVRNCTIGNNGGDGIRLEAKGASSCNGNRIVESVLAGNSASGVVFDGTGGTCNDNTIDGCEARNNGEYGIICQSAVTDVCKRNQISGCKTTGNEDAGISLVGGCTHNRVVDNVVMDNSGNEGGLTVLGGQNLISGNVVKGHADNYEFSQSNQLDLLLCEIPESLDWPCAAKLVGTLSCSQTGVNGITVNANDVTVDMAGHALVGPGDNSGDGIHQGDSHRNLKVLTGKVVHWRGSEKSGIRAAGPSAAISDIQASTNYHGVFAGTGATLGGCSSQNNVYDGIRAGSASTITACTGSKNGHYGIWAGNVSTISDCATRENRGTGIGTGDASTVGRCAAQNNSFDGISVGSGSTVSGCTAQGNGSQGILIAHESTAIGCAASGNDNVGIQGSNACTIRDCTANYNGFYGIRISYYSRVSDCVCRANGDSGFDAGIFTASRHSRIEGNLVADNYTGIQVLQPDNFIIRNTASGNTVNYAIAASNRVGVIVNAPISAAISGSTGGAGVGTTNPWANFSF